MKCDVSGLVGQRVVDGICSRLAIHCKEAGAVSIEQPEFVHVKSRGVELADRYLKRAIGSQIDHLAAECLGSESGHGGPGLQCAGECHSAPLPLSAVRFC